MFELDRRVKKRNDLFSELQRYREMIKDDTDFQEIKTKGVRVDQRTVFIAALHEYLRPDVLFD